MSLLKIYWILCSVCRCEAIRDVGRILHKNDNVAACVKPYHRFCFLNLFIIGFFFLQHLYTITVDRVYFIYQCNKRLILLQSLVMTNLNWLSIEWKCNQAFWSVEERLVVQSNLIITLFQCRTSQNDFSYSTGL